MYIYALEWIVQLPITLNHGYVTYSLRYLPTYIALSTHCFSFIFSTSSLRDGPHYPCTSLYFPVFLCLDVILHIDLRGNPINWVGPWIHLRLELAYHKPSRLTCNEFIKIQNKNSTVHITPISAQTAVLFPLLVSTASILFHSIPYHIIPSIHIYYPQFQSSLLGPATIAVPK